MEPELELLIIASPPNVNSFSLTIEEIPETDNVDSLLNSSSSAGPEDIILLHAIVWVGYLDLALAHDDSKDRNYFLDLANKGIWYASTQTEGVSKLSIQMVSIYICILQNKLRRAKKKLFKVKKEFRRLMAGKQIKAIELSEEELTVNVNLKLKKEISFLEELVSNPDTVHKLTTIFALLI